MAAMAAAGGLPPWARTESHVRSQQSLQHPRLTLWSLDHNIWRAECVRLCLFSAGVPFDDRRASWAELSQSGKMRFGTFPVLEVNGKLLGQTHAIATYVGKLTGFFPSDPWLAAKVDEVFGGLTDASDLIASTLQERDALRRAQVRQGLIAEGGRLTQVLAGLEELVAQNAAHGVCAGTELSVADFAVWRAVGWVACALDGIPSDYFPRCLPHLWGLHRMVDSLATVKEWKEAHPRQYRPVSSSEEVSSEGFTQDAGIMSKSCGSPPQDVAKKNITFL
mmetsp:Transcript_37677/g.108601  ORF Transcript_37677/g.108601 Transcript_37677/m.108601 type:complete len:278 (-) Transcript_37677:393-1226(-)